MDGYRLNITSEELTEALSVASNPLSSNMSFENSITEEVPVDHSNDKFYLFFTKDTRPVNVGVKGGKYYSLGYIDIKKDFNLGSIEKSDRPSIVSFILYTTETASVYNGPLSWVFPEGVDMVGGSAIENLYDNTVVIICNNIARVTKVYNNNSTFDKVTLLDNSVVTSSERNLDEGIYSNTGAVKIPDGVTKSDIVKIELGNIYSFHEFTIVLKVFPNLQEIVIPKLTSGFHLDVNDSDEFDVNSNLIKNGLTLTYKGTEYEWNKYILYRYKYIFTPHVSVTMNFEGDN
jgi:hypothetical protein